MQAFLFSSLVVALGLALHALVLQRHSAAEARLLNFSFAAHLVSAFAQILIYQYYYEGGDMLAYARYSQPIVDALAYDFVRWFPETLKVLLHDTTAQLPFETIGGGSTGTMLMWSVYLLFLTGGSLLAASLLIAVGSYLAKVMIYRALRNEFAEEDRLTVLAGVALIPSGVFWTSALLKEPLMMVFFGPLFLGLHLFIEGRRTLLGSVLLALGGFNVLLLKPYVMLSFAAAGGVWYVWRRVLLSRGELAVRPLYVVVGILVALVGSTAADRFFPKGEAGYAQSMAYQRRVALEVEGDSNFSLEGALGRDSTENTSALAQLALAPLALGTALYRPFLFEARKAMQALNALETTWVLIVTIQVLRRYGLARSVARILASPGLMFCFVFTLILAVGTGLASSNLGALSRYRAPMMPFFAVLLLILRKQTQPALSAPRPSLAGGGSEARVAR